MKSLIVVLVSLLLVVGCNRNARYDEFVDAYEEYLYNTQDNWENTVEIKKYITKQGGEWAVIAIHTREGFFDEVVTTFYAVELRHFKRGMNSNDVANLIANGSIDFREVREEGYGILVDYWDQWNNVFEFTGESVKDLEKAAAIKEAFKLSREVEYLSKEYGLSESRSLRIAKLHSTIKELSRTRSMTEEDMNVISIELFGLSADESLNLMESPQSSEDLLQRAAEANSVSPEHMGQILERFFK